MKISFSAFVLVFITIFFSSCQAIGDIFKTGVGVGVVGVLALIILIIFLVTRSKK